LSLGRKMRRLYATALFKALVEAGEDEQKAFELCSKLISRSYDDKKDISILASEVVKDPQILKKAEIYYARAVARLKGIRYTAYIAVAGLILLAGFLASFLPKRYVGWMFLAILMGIPLIVYLIARRTFGGGDRLG